ncbi:hypothetical protein HK104_003909 [Borealophlyctis nickersoniae]|nr:hypothetical protein HK104_003909 [Borealophlyctis nickersoniae]
MYASTQVPVGTGMERVKDEDSGTGEVEGLLGGYLVMEVVTWGVTCMLVLAGGCLWKRLNWAWLTVLVPGEMILHVLTYPLPAITPYTNPIRTIILALALVLANRRVTLAQDEPETKQPLIVADGAIQWYGAVEVWEDGIPTLGGSGSGSSQPAFVNAGAQPPGEETEKEQAPVVRYDSTETVVGE